MVTAVTPQSSTVNRQLVFYNGEEKHPDQVVMKLSELYESAEETAELELIVHVLNINQGHNEALLNACRPLREYAAYTAKVRENIRISKRAIR